MVQTEEQFIKAVEYTRKCQKAFKKVYTEANKKAAADSEKEVDRAIIEYRKKKEEDLKSQQKDLFD